MRQDDWYRSSEWTRQSQEEFFLRLNRSRSAFHKAQYCELKAVALWRTGDSLKISGALQLTERILNEWADMWPIHTTYGLRAHCFESLEKIDEAIDEYFRCFSAMDSNLKFVIQAPLDFGFLCIRERLVEHYQTATELANHRWFTDRFLVPNWRFMRSTILSILNDRLGINADDARAHARIALVAASASESGFKRNPKICLVRNPDSELIKELFQIAGQESRGIDFHKADGG